MIKVRQIKINIEEDNELNLKTKILKKLHIKETDLLTYKISKKSIDARKKPLIYFVYEVVIEVKNEKLLLKKYNKDIDVYNDEVYKITKFGHKKMFNRPIIVGSGPCGLFCAYMLASYGYKPLVIERGDDIEIRDKKVQEFWQTNKLDLNSNVQFGLGGAGTFSDGKLNTLVKDKRNIGKKVFEIFVECGAPEEIMYLQKPHIGTDLLKKVITNLKNKIINMGGDFRFNTQLTDIMVNNSKIEKIQVNNKEWLECDNLVLAIGHSARDTFRMLDKQNLSMQSKPFAVGIRISHSQKMINYSQYGVEELEKLGAANYKLTYTTKEGRGVYSFCMCPGGYVVNASSQNGRLAINGMSNHARDSKNANSAIIVSISNKDIGSNVFSGLEFQERLEQNAYNIGQGNIPIQLYKDYKANKLTAKLGEVSPLFKGNYTMANINDILPKIINDSLIEAIEYFGTKIKGFNCDDAIIAAVETRSSSPIRINRDENYCSNIKGIYPAGEGAGYAGGITTSAIDGVKVAESIISIHAPIDR